MPKVGMEKIRREQLINATLAAIEEHGFHGTTVSVISKKANLSTGIISHYFGDKAGLMDATMRYLLEQLKQDLLQHLPNSIDHHVRLNAIIDANFTSLQRSKQAAVTWLAFWTQSMHSPQLARLQQVNAKRLISNLKYSLRHLIQADKVEWSAQLIAAQIDGYWLRCALSHEGDNAYAAAVETCKTSIANIIRDHAVQTA
ncbi:transcriptional regulator BetI [Pseudomonas sp. HK3]|jgi:TetR/AcrR family transcriptional repressor of bet genes